MIKDELVDKLIERKRLILRTYDRGNFTEEEYVKQLSEIEEAIRERNKELMTKAEVERDKELAEEKIVKQVEEEKKKDSRGRTPKGDSYASCIEKVLCMEEVKSIDDVFNKLKELKPGKTKAAIERMTKNIIREVIRQQQPRWRGYKWNEEEFLLIQPK